MDSESLLQNHNFFKQVFPDRPEEGRSPRVSNLRRSFKEEEDQPGETEAESAGFEGPPSQKSPRLETAITFSEDAQLGRPEEVKESSTEELREQGRKKDVQVAMKFIRESPM